MSDQNRNEEIKKALLGVYKRPESRSVGKMELRNLPLRAGVAVAVRCVYRLRPVFRPCDDDPHREISLAIFDAAIEVGERFVRSEDVSGIKIKEIAEHAEQVARRAIPGAILAYAAAHLAQAVRDSVAGDGEGAINAAATALSVCLRAAPVNEAEACAETDKLLAGQLLDGGPDSMRDPIANDYETAVSLALGSFPDLGDPLDPSENGPLGRLWLDEAPTWFRDRRNG